MLDWLKETRCLNSSSKWVYILFHNLANQWYSKVWVKKTGHIQNLVISKKIYNFCPILMKLSENDCPWANHFHQVSWGLDKNSWFFTIGQYLNLTCFFLLRHYRERFIYNSSINVCEKKSRQYWSLDRSVCHKASLTINLNYLVRLYLLLLGWAVVCPNDVFAKQKPPPQ